MISHEDIVHVLVIKRWSEEARAAAIKFSSKPLIARLLKRIPDSEQAMRVFDNVDWLVAIITREYAAQSRAKKASNDAVDKTETS